MSLENSHNTWCPTCSKMRHEPSRMRVRHHHVHVCIQQKIPPCVKSSDGVTLIILAKQLVPTQHKTAFQISKRSAPRKHENIVMNADHHLRHVGQCCCVSRKVMRQTEIGTSCKSQLSAREIYHTHERQDKTPLREDGPTWSVLWPCGHEWWGHDPQEKNSVNLLDSCSIGMVFHVCFVEDNA